MFQKYLINHYEEDSRGLRIDFLGNRFKITTKFEHKEYYQKLIENCGYVNSDIRLFCEKCGKKIKTKKILRITNLPEILILSIQRYNFLTGKKNNVSIKFPEELDLSDYMDIEIFTGEAEEIKTEYKLFGINNHAGTLDFGHYYSYIYIPLDKEWYLFNDAHVDKTNISFQKTQVYALFYKKIND